jgi:hypothetical protein
MEFSQPKNNSKDINIFLMKNVSKILLILLVTIAIFAISCNASKKSNCGCPSKSGMIGY